MGLRFGFGLPGPFSWSTNVFPRMPRGRIIRTSAPRSCPHCDEHEQAEPEEVTAPGIGFYVTCLGLLAALGLAVRTESTGLFILAALVSVYLGSYATNRRAERKAARDAKPAEQVKPPRGPHDWPDSPARWSNRR